jgi:hypothetical protein
MFNFRKTDEALARAEEFQERPEWLAMTVRSSKMILSDFEYKSNLALNSLITREPRDY